MNKFFLLAIVLVLAGFVSAASFSVNPVFFKMTGQGDSISEQQLIIISNEDRQVFLLESSSDFFSVSENSFTLDKGQSKSVSLFFDKLQQGLYFGKIRIAGNDEIDVPIVVAIESGSPEFGVSTQQFASDLFFGQDIKIETDFVRLRGQNSVAVANYTLRDVDGNIIYSESEILSIPVVGQHVKTTKSMFAPKESGKYIFSVSVEDISRTTISISPSVFFVSDKKSFSGSRYAMILAIVVLVMTIVFVVFNYAWSRTLTQSTQYWKEEVKSLKTQKFSDSARQIRKVKSRLELLERAYNSGYIKKKSYLEARKALNSIVANLKKRL